MKRSYLPFILWMAFMTFMLLMPSNSVPSSLANFEDSLIHAVILFIAAWLWYLPVLKVEIPLRHHFIALVGFAFYSVLTEVVQETMVPGRSGDVSDFLSNMAGVLLALLSVLGYRKLYRNAI